MKINYEDTITLVALAAALIMTIYLEQKTWQAYCVLGGYITLQVVLSVPNI